jgi:pimeloyl-ACP methyl ester carboxylesterase/quercetin dioxygenase-like cupin family protein
MRDDAKTRHSATREAAVSKHTIVVGSAEIHVDVRGAGPAVVLLHGLGLRGALWKRMLDGFSEAHRLVVLDLRGAGATRETAREELSLARWADDLGAVLDALEVERPVIVGHSLGASIALKYALERPDGVRSLVLIGAEADLSNLAPRMTAAAERIRATGMQAWVDEFWSKNPPFSDASLARDASLLTEYRELLLENDPEDYVRQCLAIASAESLSGRLRDVRQPVLVLVGGSDDRTLPEHGRRLAHELPDARVVELPDVGHTIPLEAPGETARAIAEFLAELGDGDGDAPRPHARVLRADTTPRNTREGPFGHLDVRWVVGPDTGASLISFGQSTYPFRATHPNHYHPNAEEVVMVVSGRGIQIVGHETLDMGPGDICFIPRNTPHRITGASDDEDLVILWAFGGAASLEDAGYVPLPDDAKEAM